MADIKISELPTLINIDEDDFVLANDVSTATTKKITRERLLNGITRNVVDSGENIIIAADATVNNELKVGGDIFTTGDITFGSLTDYINDIKITGIIGEEQGIVNNDSNAFIPTVSAVRSYIDLLVDSVYVGEINAILSTSTTEAAANTIAKRDSSGNLSANSPSAPNHLVTLSYFNDNGINNGDFGLGADSNPGYSGLDSTNVSGFYSYIGGDLANPTGTNRGGVFDVKRHTDRFLVQEAVDATTSNKYMRYSDSNGASWKDWVEFWTTNNLTKTTSSTDRTDGSVVTIDGTEGWYGLGGLESIVRDSDNTMKNSPNGFYQLNGVTLDNGQNFFGSALRLTRGTDGNKSTGSIIYSGAGGTVGNNAPEVYVQATSGTIDDWGPVHEFWTTANLQKVQNDLDNILGRVMTVGYRGIGGHEDLRGTVYELGNPQDIYASGLTQGLASAIDLDITNQFTSIDPLGVLVTQGQWTNSSGQAAAASRYFLGRSSENDNARVFYQTNLDDTTWSAWVEVWTSDNLVKTTNSKDATAGRMLQVGDWGVGSRAVQLSGNNFDSADKGGFYFGYAGNHPTSPSEGVNPFPTEGGAVGMLATGTAFGTPGEYVFQIASPFTTNPNNQKLAYRTSTGGGNNLVDKEWTNVWDENNLVKITSTTDNTNGRVVLASSGQGYFGLGGSSSPTVNDANQLQPTGFYIGGGGSASNFPVTLDLGQTAFMPFMSMRRQSSDATGSTLHIGKGNGNTTVAVVRSTVDGGTTWYNEELWSTGNLVKTTGPTDGTEGRVPVMRSIGGIFGLGAVDVNPYPNADLDDLTNVRSGTYGAFAPTINTANNFPLDANLSNYILEVEFERSGAVKQTFTFIRLGGAQSLRTFKRTSYAGTFTPWVEELSTEQLPNKTTQDFVYQPEFARGFSSDFSGSGGNIYKLYDVDADYTGASSFTGFAVIRLPNTTSSNAFVTVEATIKDEYGPNCKVEVSGYARANSNGDWTNPRIVVRQGSNNVDVVQVDFGYDGNQPVIILSTNGSWSSYCTIQLDTIHLGWQGADDSIWQDQQNYNVSWEVSKPVLSNSQGFSSNSTSWIDVWNTNSLNIKYDQDYWGGNSTMLTPHNGGGLEFFGTQGSFKTALTNNSYRNSGGGVTITGANSNTSGEGAFFEFDATGLSYKTGTPSGTTLSNTTLDVRPDGTFNFNGDKVYHQGFRNHAVNRSSAPQLSKMSEISDFNLSATSGSSTLSINGSNFSEGDIIYLTKERTATEYTINSSNGSFVYEDGAVDTQLVLNTGWSGTVKLYFSSNNFRTTVMG